MMNMELNGIIHTRFHSQSEMADFMGWSRQRLNKILNCKREPSLQDVCRIAETLGITFDKAVGFFMPKRSPDGD